MKSVNEDVDCGTGPSGGKTTNFEQEQIQEENSSTPRTN